MKFHLSPQYKILLIICEIVLLIYIPLFNIYFSQDDFFHFIVSQTDNTLTGFFNLFGFHSFNERGIAFYRPLFREITYNLNYSLFGLNPLPFRILQFLIFFTNIFLIYKLFIKLVDRRSIAYFTAFFYAISGANLASFYYLAGGIQSLGATMFILLSIYFFHEYLRNKKLIYTTLSFLFFILALASHELAGSLLLILSGLIFLLNKPKKVFKTIFSTLWIYYLIQIIYFYLDFFVIGFSKSETQYQISISLKSVLNTFGWYVGWAFGLPEMLIDFVNPGLKLNPNLLKYWVNYYVIIFTTFFISLPLLIFISLKKIVTEKDLLRNNQVIFFLFFWFMVSLFPVIFLPTHKSTYYLSPALIPFWGLIGYIIFSEFSYVKIKLCLLLLLITLNLTTIVLGQKTYWAANRGKLANSVLSQIKNKYPTLPKKTSLYIINDPKYPKIAREWGSSSKQIHFILNGADAIRLLYKDMSLNVYYEDLNKTEFQNNPSYKIMPRITN